MSASNNRVHLTSPNETPLPSLSLNLNQRRLLEIYMNLYNRTSRQIDNLQEQLNEIRRSIDFISGIHTNDINQAETLRRNRRNNPILRRNTSNHNETNPTISDFQFMLPLSRQRRSVDNTGNINQQNIENIINLFKFM